MCNKILYYYTANEDCPGDLTMTISFKLFCPWCLFAHCNECGIRSIQVGPVCVEMPSRSSMTPAQLAKAAGVELPF